MTEASFRTEPCTSYTRTSDADTKHYDIPLVMWFRNNGQPPNYPATFTPDTGYKPSFRNTDDGSDYIVDRTIPFWPEEGNLANGFGIRQPVLNAFSKNFNVEISGGIGHWLPVPLVRSISFYWRDVNGEPGAWKVRHLALVLRNWRTDEQKTWGSNLNSEDTTTGIKKIDSNFVYITSWGPDWYVYGVIFNIARAGEYGGSAPEAKLADFRLGYEYPDLDSSKHRMAIGKAMGWQNFRTAMSKGEMQFEPITPLEPIAEWDWRGERLDTDLSNMCFHPGVAWTYYESTSYLAQTDRNGTNVKNAIDAAWAENNTLWYKHDDSPAVSIPSSKGPIHYNSNCFYTHDRTKVGGSASSGGILRCYDRNPDAV